MTFSFNLKNMEIVSVITENITLQVIKIKENPMLFLFTFYT